MSITLRPYNPADWEQLRVIHDAARKIELRFAGLDDAFLPLDIAAEREDLFDYHLRVAELNGTVAGFAAFTEEELAWLYVNPTLHRRGIGKALVLGALAEMPTVRELEVLVGNTPARALYESCGFRLEKTVSGVMPGNEGFPVTVWCMER